MVEMTAIVNRNASVSDTQGNSAVHRPASFKYRKDAADYIGTMIMELRRIAEQAELAKIVGTLDAAYYEVYNALSEEDHRKGRESEKTSKRT
jgi:hypothetical protein